MAKTRSTKDTSVAKRGTKPPPKKKGSSSHKRTIPAKKVQKERTGKHKKRKSESESEDESAQIRKLMEQNQRLRAMSEAAAAAQKSKKGKKKAKKPGTATGVDNVVKSTTKSFLFPRVKVIKNEAAVQKATRMIMNRLDLQNLTGLEGQDLATAEQIWIENSKDLVREAINGGRNYVNQEVQKVITAAVKEGTLDTFPNPETILKCALRDDIYDLEDEDELEELQEDQKEDESDEDFKIRKEKLEDLEGRIAERDLMRTHFDNYLDILLPKVSGFRHCGPKNRCAFAPSFTHRAPEQCDLPTDTPIELVTPSDEAFMVALFENSYKRWKYCADQDKAGEPVDRKHAEWDTKCTNLRGGQKMFGGWETEGRKRINKLTKDIAQNRIDNPGAITHAEEAAIKRLRAKHKLSEKKAGAKRKAAAAAEEDSDSEDSFFADPKSGSEGEGEGSDTEAEE